jgi:SAM-dependent methyltransferase
MKYFVSTMGQKDLPMIETGKLWFSPRFSSGLSHLVAEVGFRLRTSWKSPCYWIADRFKDHWADRRFRIVSAENRSPAQLGINLPGCSNYQPISYSDLFRLLNRIEISSEDVFLDFGSGMGRALCVAATYRFRSVLGVEISAELCRIAEQNIHRARLRLQCQDVRITNANAAEYLVPLEVSIVYFFNPFGPTLLSAVFENLAASLRNAPRPLRLVFYGTAASREFRNAAAQCDWLALRTQWTGEAKATSSAE